MANSSTGVSLPISAKNGDFTSVKRYAIVLDTVDSDLTVHTTTTGYCARLIALSYAEADAHNLTIKSGSTTLVTYQMPANSGIDKDSGLSPIITSPGEDLVFRVSTAGIATMVALVAEFPQAKIDI